MQRKEEEEGEMKGNLKQEKGTKQEEEQIPEEQQDRYNCV